LSAFIQIACNFPYINPIKSKNGLNSEFYASQWFLTLFAYDFSQEISWKIFDAFLIKGWTIIYAAALVILHLFMRIFLNEFI